MVRCGLALAVRVARPRPPVEATDAACGNHLALLLHVALVVARIEQFEEGDDAEEDGGGVDGEGVCVFIERLVPEQGVVVLQRCLRFEREALGASDSAVGDQDVDVADFLFDA